MFNATAAALEKREGMTTGQWPEGLRLLAALARRPAWLLAMALAALAWVGEAASLAPGPGAGHCDAAQRRARSARRRWRSLA